MNCFCILSIWAIVLDGTSFTKARCTTFDVVKVLKIKIFPLIVTCHILDNFINFLYVFCSSNHFLAFCYMKKEFLIF